jgi:hypothetical protein
LKQLIAQLGVRGRNDETVSRDNLVGDRGKVDCMAAYCRNIACSREGLAWRQTFQTAIPSIRTSRPQSSCGLGTGERRGLC